MTTIVRSPVVTLADLAAWVDQQAAEMSNAGWTDNDAKALVEKATPETRSLAEVLRDRLKVYENAAPWDLYPAQEHGQKLAMMLVGLDEHEYDSVIDAYLDPIEADLIRHGFCAKVASDWCEGLAGEAGIYQFDIEHAGGLTSGMA